MGPYLELLPSERAGTSFLVQITYKDGYGRTRVRGLSAPEAVFVPGRKGTARSAMRWNRENPKAQRARTRQ
eukprot:278576-Pleurochrysis_carterae.AAC.1